MGHLIFAEESLQCPMRCVRQPGSVGILVREADPAGGGVSPWPVGPAITQPLGTARALEQSTRRPVNGPGNPRPHPAAGQSQRNVSG